MIPQQKITDFQRKILDWYQKNQRDLPWRRTRDPYKILISEVMSQQTQLARVIPKYEAWIENFPTVQSLAAAKVSDVLHYWSGLGYNRRALNLKKTAEVIVEKYNCEIPKTEKELLSLPGIGQYTARALLCLSIDQQIAVVDTNVRKVILTQFLNSENSEESGNQKFRNSESLNVRDSDSLESFQSFPKKSGNKISEPLIDKIAIQLLPIGHAYEWNQALMDYSAAVLKKKKYQFLSNQNLSARDVIIADRYLNNFCKRKKFWLLRSVFS